MRYTRSRVSRGRRTDPVPVAMQMDGDVYDLVMEIATRDKISRQQVINDLLRKVFSDDSDTR